MLTFKLDIVLIWLLNISYHIPAMTCTVMEPHEGEHLSKILVYQLEHITQKGRLGVLKMSFPQQGFMNQRCNETPPFMTTWRDIASLYSAEGHCYLQCTQPHPNYFYISSHINISSPPSWSLSKSKDKSLPKTTNVVNRMIIQLAWVPWWKFWIIW